jgi:hypothetical protein
MQNLLKVFLPLSRITSEKYGSWFTIETDMKFLAKREYFRVYCFADGVVVRGIAIIISFK